MVVSVFRCLEEAFIGDLRSLQLHFRKVFDRPFGFVIERVLLTYDGIALRRNVAGSQAAFPAVGAIYLELFAELPVWFRVAPAAEGIVVHKDSVVPVADYERNRNLGIVLIQFLVASLMVEFERLLLPKAIEGFPVRGVEHQPGGISILAFHRYRGECHPVPVKYAVTLL